MEEIVDLYGQADQEMMYQAAIRQPLERKVDQALALIRTYEGQALSLSPTGYYVCFSGGKDSIVMAKLFEMAGVQYKLHYANVTIDPPELVQFIKREYPQAVWHSVGMTLPSYMSVSANGPPSRLKRWCCEVYKESNSPDLFSAIGVRAEESVRRKGLWRTVAKDKKSAFGVILCPILYWTDKDVWNFIRQNKMPYCSLYDAPVGKKRLGCIGCPLATPKQRKEDFARWPKHEAMWKRGFKKYWDTYRGVPTKRGELRTFEKYATIEEHWDAWLNDGADSEDADCQMWLW